MLLTWTEQLLRGRWKVFVKNKQYGLLKSVLPLFFPNRFIRIIQLNSLFTFFAFPSLHLLYVLRRTPFLFSFVSIFNRSLTAKILKFLYIINNIIRKNVESSVERAHVEPRIWPVIRTAVLLVGADLTAVVGHKIRLACQQRHTRLDTHRNAGFSLDIRVPKRRNRTWDWCAKREKGIRKMFVNIVWLKAHKGNT